MGELFVNGISLCTSVKTGYKSQHRKGSELAWNEWLHFPIKISELARDTVLCITIFDVFSPRKHAIIGGTTFALFDQYGYVVWRIVGCNTFG